jgi:hypothetical protein
VARIGTHKKRVQTARKKPTLRPSNNKRGLVMEQSPRSDHSEGTPRALYRVPFSYTVAANAQAFTQYFMNVGAP